MDEFLEFMLPQKSTIMHALGQLTEDEKKDNADGDYIVIFTERELGILFENGQNGYECYVDELFTNFAIKNVKKGSKLLSINDYTVKPKDTLYIVQQFIDNKLLPLKIKFRPYETLNSDTNYPISLFQMMGFDGDIIKNEDDILVAQFDVKKKKFKEMKEQYKKLMGNDVVSLSFSGNIDDITEDMELLMKLKYGNIWYKMPEWLLKILRIELPNIKTIKIYGKHCIHCPKLGTWKFIIHQTMENENYSKLSYFITIFIMTCIILSTLSYILESVPKFVNKQPFKVIEYIVSIIFTIEYVIRISVCRHIVVYFFDGLNMIDFLAILPFWIELLSGNAGSAALRVIRVVRLARVFRLLKTPRYIKIYCYCIYIIYKHNII